VKKQLDFSVHIVYDIARYCAKAQKLLQKPERRRRYYDEKRLRAHHVCEKTKGYT